MCPLGRMPGSGQQAFFLDISPPSSCPFILSFLVRKQKKTTPWGDWLNAAEDTRQDKGKQGSQYLRHSLWPLGSGGAHGHREVAKRKRQHLLNRR